MSIEKHAGLRDDQLYVIPLYNPDTKQTIKGLKVTGKELTVLVNALNASIQQQALIDDVKLRDEKIQQEVVQENSPPDEGGNPLLDNKGTGYETVQEWKKPQQAQNENQFGPKVDSITTNPENKKPPRLP